METIDPALLIPPSEPFTIGPGDKLAIEIVANPATRAEATVGPDGKVYYNVLPGLDVWGLTPIQARDRIAQELEKFMRQKPSVALTVRQVESKRVWFLGRFNNPGIYPLTGPTTLLEAMAEAGGPSSSSPFASLAGALGISAPGKAADAADLNHGFVIRQGRRLPVSFERLLREGDLSQNIYLMPDDFVCLPSAEAQEVYVLGAVAQPQSVSFSGGPTLAQAIAGAGGTVPDAYLSHVAIVRGSLSAPQIAIVDYRAIVHGKALDVQLEPRDIVYIPLTPYHTLERYANLIVDTFARTMGVNEGAHAVTSHGVPVGINVPIGP